MKKAKSFLDESLNLFMNTVFREMNIYKISIITDEEINTRPFVENGFMLEGIITNSIISKNIKKNEVIFGINEDAFSNLGRINVLRYAGEKIELKILTLENAKDMLEYYKKNKDHLRHYEPTRDESFYSIEAQRQIIMESYKQFLNGVGANFGIFRGKKLIGKIQLSGIIFGVFRSGIVGYSEIRMSKAKDL